MADRTTINIDKETHSAAKEIKQEYNESWPEVLEWYVNNRGENTEEPSIDAEELAATISDELEIPAFDIDANELATQVAHELADNTADTEMAAYRGAKDALEALK